MQLSAANLLIASQQAAKAAPRPAADPTAFAAALAKEKTSFEPLAFKQVAAPETPQSAAALAPQAKPAGSMPLGSQIDIKV